MEDSASLCYLCRAKRKKTRDSKKIVKAEMPSHIQLVSGTFEPLQYAPGDSTTRVPLIIPNAVVNDQIRRNVKIRVLELDGNCYKLNGYGPSSDSTGILCVEGSLNPSRINYLGFEHPVLTSVPIKIFWHLVSSEDGYDDYADYIEQPPTKCFWTMPLVARIQSISCRSNFELTFWLFNGLEFKRIHDNSTDGVIVMKSEWQVPVRAKQPDWLSWHKQCGLEFPDPVDIGGHTTGLLQFPLGTKEVQLSVQHFVRTVLGPSGQHTEVDWTPYRRGV